MSMAGFICAGSDCDMHTMRNFFLLLALTLNCVSRGAAEPRVFSVAPGVLPKIKARLAMNDSSLAPALKKLTSDAEKALKLAPTSVMDKPRAGASGDKHDYFSQAPYFWPNPTNKNGLPYIRKDGERNPESGNDNSDAPRMGRMADNVETLALAFYFTGKDAYAAHAATLLRVWFLDSATRMNPNLNQAQAVPGVNDGRAAGVLESRSLASVCDAVELIAGSPRWTKADDAALRVWMREFLTWLQTSKNGKAEAAAKNNHGSWYDVQLAHIALFLGETNLARSVVEAAKEKRIAAQINPDGTQPLELARADSFGYSRFNVQALFALANLGDHLGVDLWRYETENGASLRKAFDYLFAYVEDQSKPWPHERKKEVRVLGSALRQAAAVYQDDRYVRALGASNEAPNLRDRLLIPLN